MEGQEDEEEWTEDEAEAEIATEEMNHDAQEQDG
jgi:hypothetical protein